VRPVALGTWAPRASRFGRLKIPSTQSQTNSKFQRFHVRNQDATGRPGRAVLRPAAGDASLRSVEARAGDYRIESRRLLIDRLAAADIPVHFLELNRSWQFVPGVVRLAGMLRAQRAEIVQSFLYHANVASAFAARLAGVKRLVTGIRVADPRRSRAWIERWATCNASAIACVSQSVAEHCRRRGFPAKKLVVIPNGIDLDRWRDAKPADLSRFGIPAGRRVLLYVGRLDAQKGLDRFLRGLPGLLVQLPGHDFLLVGEGDQAPLLREIDIRFADQAELPSRIHFAGWQDDIPGILAASDLLILPSRWEGMPNAILEAMAAGKPVMASRAEGVLELLGDASAEQTGEFGESGEIPAAMIEILTNSAIANDLGRRNRERAIQQFSMEKMVAGYERLLFAVAAT
jgi:glycosyltransferase involved in cell wall biosynthesis